MNQSSTLRAGRSTILFNRLKTYLSKPYNVILLLMGIVVTVTTFAPIAAIIQDTITIHPGTIDAHLTGQAEGYTLVNYIDLFTSNLAKTNLWTPLINTLLMSVGACVVSILFGGIMAFLVTRTNLAFRKYLSSIFIFPYICRSGLSPSCGRTSSTPTPSPAPPNGLLAATLGIEMPAWWCVGLFPSVIVLGLHYAPSPTS